MASTPNSLNPTGPTPKMMPEGSRKICVLNGSRQLDHGERRVDDYQGSAGKRAAQGHLPTGRSHRRIPARMARNPPTPGRFCTSIARRSTSFPARALSSIRARPSPIQAKGDQIVAGRTYTVGYVNGKGTARPGCCQSAATAAQRLEGRRHFDVTTGRPLAASSS